MNIHIISLTGKRPQNEDAHDVIVNMNGKDPNLAPVNFYGVYDGHGGKAISKFLKDNISKFFTKKNILYPLKPKYIYDVYQYLDKILKQKFYNKAVHCGSTCMIATHFKKNNVEYVTVMNTGDSRTVLCRGNVAIPLTKDHKPSWPEEKRRIEKLGGQIMSDGTDYRIKDLSVSRAFGDFDAAPFLINTPDIFRYKIEKNDKFMIMACDGLWDVLSNHDAINYVLNECYDETLTKRINKNINIARKLAEYALFKGSMDNLTVIVIFFN